MTEREMLEAAARAMGWKDPEVHDMRGWGEVRYGLSEAVFAEEYGEYWNPRVSGEDSQMLAAFLRISVEHSPADEKRPWVCASVSTNIGSTQQFMEDVPDESQRADRMRLAILRCAAAQALAMGAETAENGSKTAGNGVDAGFHRGRGVAPKEQA